MNHTKEPWIAKETNEVVFDVMTDDEYCVATCLDGVRSEHNAGENAQRIVACVNSCAGMSDPAAEIAALRAEVERLKADAERLDFIASRCRADPRMDGNHVYWPTSFNHRLTGPNLRAAIDAARGNNEPAPR